MRTLVVVFAVPALIMGGLIAIPTGASGDEAVLADLVQKYLTTR